MADFSGRVCLVTGAGRGIGAAIAEAFAGAGATTVLTDISGDAANALAARLGQSAYTHDTSLEADWIRIIADVELRLGRLDVLVNNAGYGWQKRLINTTQEEWQRLMAVNVDGYFLGMKHAIPLMARTGGSIVNISSVYGLVGGAGTSAYCASKGAVTLMTKAVALECAEDGNGIRVNSLHPGYVRTPSVAETLTPDEIEGLDKFHPIGRIAEPAEIARAALFLASDDASFMTGAEMVVDGGYTAR